MRMLKQGLAVTSFKGITSSEVFNASFPLCILMSHKLILVLHTYEQEMKISTLFEHFGGNPKEGCMEE